MRARHSVTAKNARPAVRQCAHLGEGATAVKPDGRLPKASDIATHISPAIWTAAMKTTVEIADALLREARKLAAREGTTLRALIDEGLRRVLAEKKRTSKSRFRLRLVTAGGRGLRPELHAASWDQIRDLSYRRGEE
jgi:hypothetical protein